MLLFPSASAMYLNPNASNSAGVCCTAEKVRKRLNMYS
jgi:hypothetical protein